MPSAQQRKLLAISRNTGSVFLYLTEGDVGVSCWQMRCKEFAARKRLPLSCTCSPQHFHGISLTGKGGNPYAINFKSSTCQKFIFEVDDHMLLVAIGSWYNLFDFKILINIVALL
jgi:hypothetical protein